MPALVFHHQRGRFFFFIGGFTHEDVIKVVGCVFGI